MKKIAVWYTKLRQFSADEIPPVDVITSSIRFSKESNLIKDAHDRSAIMAWKVKFGAKILPLYSHLA